MKEKFNTSDLYLAEVKYADKEKGIEVMEPISYAFVYHQDNSFYNVITKEEHPTYERVPYPNRTIDGEDYGTKVKLLNDIDITGECYLLISNCKDLFKEDKVSKDTIDEYMLNSTYYFKDRVGIAINRLTELKQPFKMIRIIKNEYSKKEEIDEYFKERERSRQKVKQWK